MNNKIIYGIGGLVIGFVLASFFVKALPERGGMMMGNVDRHFIEQMIPHHEGAVAMAKLALEKAKRPEIKTLASSIIESQTKEIQDMRSWYKDWFKADVPKNTGMMMGGGMMSGDDDMDSLENAVDFDKAFIEAMIPHHQLALMMVRMLEAGSDRPEMLQLAKNITTSQSKEIEEMKAWYIEWYK